ncbi:MAG: hypothetical protein OXI81_16940 [Paracoccaceae bacterium]|nr:hypothetical protein [Paracoccaceae bacterium]
MRHKNSEEVKVSHLVQYFSRLASLNNNDTLGSKTLRSALLNLNRALKPHAELPVSQLAKELDIGKSSNNWKPSRTREKIALPDDLESISMEQADEILQNDRFLKKQLVELGTRRFNMPPSLNSQSRSGVIREIKTVIENRRLIKTIGRHAKIAGTARSR